MNELDRRMEKTRAIQFITNWRIYLMAEQLDKAEGYFVGGWSTNGDLFCVNVLHQMSFDELEIIMSYPIWQ